MLSRRTFVVTPERIEWLKQRITQGHVAPQQPPSTFVAVSALAWTAFVRSKSLDRAGGDAHLCFLADVRTRLDPPVDEGYFGNLIKGCFATAPAGEFSGPDALPRASSAIQAAIREALDDPMSHNWMDRFMVLPLDRLANVAASPRFRVYETDFGWGKPTRVELVSMNHDGEIVLVGGRDAHPHLRALPRPAPLPRPPSIPQSSLSATLRRFLPLAGKLAYLPATGDVAVDCSAAAVAFVEAEADGGDLRSLAGDEEHDVAAFQRLVPELGAAELPAPVLAVQATRLAGGGAAVGVSAHHAVADGRAVWQFLAAWAAECRGAADAELGAAPTFDRAAIGHPRADEVARALARRFTPDLPKLRFVGYSFEGRLKLTRRTFVVSPERIEWLKQRIAQSHMAPQQPPSTFVAVTALAWTAFVRSKSLDRAGGDTHLCFIVDIRTRLDPPVDEGYFGNLIKGSYATAPAGEFAGPDALPAPPRRSKRRSARRWTTRWPGSRAGWTGSWRSRWTEPPACRRRPGSGCTRPISGGVSRAGSSWCPCTTTGERAGPGPGRWVQVSVSLSPDHIDAFKAHFFNEADQALVD
uniref:Uncharacterized protein n=1 Tax=Ananas comosus var. bracteatus TaxID=296719 RepID=A0A6V7P6H7_ANACO|nr:unnamed protein product [Ananas comosus var. bracteatus]